MQLDLAYILLKYLMNVFKRLAAGWGLHGRQIHQKWSPHFANIGTQETQNHINSFGNFLLHRPQNPGPMSYTIEPAKFHAQHSVVM